MEAFTDLEVTALEVTATAEPDPWRRLVAMVDRSRHTSAGARRVLVEFWRSAMREADLRAYTAEVRADAGRRATRTIASMAKSPPA
jgi:hypothetical protein